MDYLDSAQFHLQKRVSQLNAKWERWQKDTWLNIPITRGPSITLFMRMMFLHLLLKHWRLHGVMEKSLQKFLMHYICHPTFSHDLDYGRNLLTGTQGLLRQRLNFHTKVKCLHIISMP